MRRTLAGAGPDRVCRSLRKGPEHTAAGVS